MTLTDKVERSLRALGVADHDRVGIACSGGADSVALLHLVARSSRAGAPVVLHVDHQLRPGSDDDAAFVESLAKELGLRCAVLSVDVEKKHRGGLEAAAREVRYSSLERAAHEWSLDHVLTAHTKEDQAETVLLRTIRGGSLAGIAGVRGIFVRPMLDVRRSELRQWLRDEGLTWCEDPTNDDVRLERNWIRSEVLPLLLDRRSGVVDVLARLAERSRSDQDALDTLAEAVVERAEVDETGLLLRANDIDSLPTAVLNRVVRGALRRCGVDPRWTALDAVATLDVGAHVSCDATAVWRLPDGLAVVRDPMPVPAVQALPHHATVDAEPWGIRIRVGSADAPAWRWRCDVPVDAQGLMLRTRRPGDRVQTKIGSKKVQDVLVDAKVPRPLRDLVPVVSTTTTPLAVVGLTVRPGPTSLVVDVEPADPTWSKRTPWTRPSG